MFVVTPDGVVLPKGNKYKIPDNYVENKYQPGRSFGVESNGKFQEKLRIDPATAPGKKGPTVSHYHLNGKKKHYSPTDEKPDPGFNK